MTSVPDPWELANPFRADLRAGKSLIGCWLSMANIVSTELIGYAGFDWLLVDGEHAPNDLDTFVTQLLALKDSPSAPIVRPQSADPVLIKRLLDIGYRNLLLPSIHTGAAARDAVAATRYPPRGMRGVGLAHRANRYGHVVDYFAHADDEIAVVVQIESPEAVAAVTDIASVDGIDAVFVGPSDLAASLGYLGQPSHPDVQAAIVQVVERATAVGTPTGILAFEEADVRRYLGLGMTLVAVGGDTGLLRSSSVALRDRYRDIT